MANPPRKKGTGFETEIQPLLQEIWPKAQAIGTKKGPNDYGDYVGVDPWLIEAKKWNKWAMMEWIRAARDKVNRATTLNPTYREFLKEGIFRSDLPWMIVVAADRRKLPGRYALMPLEQALELIKRAEGAA